MKVIFLFWIISKELVVIYLHWLNMSFSINKDRKRPNQLKNMISKDRYNLSKAYLKDHTIFAMVCTSFDILITTLILLFFIPKLERFLLSFTGSYQWQGLLFYFVIFMITFIVSILSSWYENFKIEAKYGFNKTRLNLFFLDLGKSFLVSVILGGLILSPILNILEKYTYWWLGLSIGTFLFSILSIWLFPVIIFPLFNKFKPLVEGVLKDSIVSFTIFHKIPISKVFVMDASTRTSHGNAFLTGMGSSRRLVLFDTILHYPTEEILSIISHEWGHHKHLDIVKQLIVSTLSMSGIFFLSNLLFLSGTIQQIFFVKESYIVLYISFLLISPILFYLNPITNWFIRKHEFEADLFSLQMTKALEPSITSLKRLISDNLSNLNPHPLFRLFYYTHPAPAERIQNLIRQAKKLNIS